MIQSMRPNNDAHDGVHQNTQSISEGAVAATFPGFDVQMESSTVREN